MTAPQGVEKHSVSMPAATSESVRSRVGARGFSGYVAAAVARQLERDALDDVLAARARGQSVVLRPETAYDGLDLVLQQLSAVSAGPVHVTDLLGATATQVGESVAAGTPRSAQALLAYHTSGSTGSPKCVVYQDGRVESHAAAVAAALGLDLSLIHI